VSEWCADWYDAEYYGTAPAADPKGPLRGTLRVIRGGSWFEATEMCLAYRRNYGAKGKDHRNPWLGFRCAADARKR
jgi:formylglycine-generating enzyme required for sulfatase activity